MRHIDLFSGIGGFALATDRVWGGYEQVEHLFCDNDSFSQLVLNKHWPQAKIYGDIRTLTTNTRIEKSGRISGKSWEKEIKSWIGCEILTGGFPCQPFSQAGKRRGTADDRHLWPEMLRVIREFNPRWVIGENVGGFVTWDGGMVLEQVHIDLENSGYEVQAFIIPAVAKNAPHRRDRVWIVAHRKSERVRGSTCEKCGLQERIMEQTKQKGNKVRSQSKRCNCNASNPKGFNEKWSKRKRNSRGRSKGQDWNTDWNASWVKVASRLCRVDDGISKRMDRSLRLKALGNAIVPQVAEEIMMAIKKTPKTSDGQ